MARLLLRTGTAMMVRHARTLPTTTGITATVMGTGTGITAMRTITVTTAFMGRWMTMTMTRMTSIQGQLT
jgi:hypothetical protein